MTVFGSGGACCGWPKVPGAVKLKPVLVACFAPKLVPKPPRDELVPKPLNDVFVPKPPNVFPDNEVVVPNPPNVGADVVVVVPKPLNKFVVVAGVVVPNDENPENPKILFY